MLDVLMVPEHLDRADFAMLALHGRNANKAAFLPFVRQFDFAHTRWLLPSAPHSDASERNVRWWFEHETENREEIAGSRNALGALIRSQMAEGIPPENIFLIGFSQGAVMAVDTGLRFPFRLGGIVALSGYIADPASLPGERHASNLRTPIFLAHGTRDRILPIDVGRNNHRILLEMECQATYKEYETGHRICKDETRDIRVFLYRHMYGMEFDDPRKRDEHIVPF